MENELFFKGKFGLERETLRVDKDLRLAQTPHPFTDTANITRDFCENQIELITSVCSSVEETVSELKKLDSAVRSELDKNGESIWMYSNPPHIENEDEIPVANFTGRHSEKRRYREQLEKRYGKRLMLFSGIHFNFSFDDGYLHTIYKGDDFSAWRDGFYLRLYKQVSFHSWLPLLLTAASPIYDRSLDEDGAEGAVLGKYSSVRSSERGYWNSFVPILRFGSLADFVESIKEYVDNGELFSASELYLPVRLKPKGVNHIDNFADGVSHIELRMFDLNPMEELGIDGKDLEFSHLLIMYLSTQDDLDFTPERQVQAVENHRKAALYDLEDVTIDGVPILEKARQILDSMEEFFSSNTDAVGIIRYEKDKLKNRICEKIRKKKICG